jgi:hypothetical protein
MLVIQIHSVIRAIAFVLRCGLTLLISLPTISGNPARGQGYRDPGFIHTAFLKDLWPNRE